MIKAIDLLDKMLQLDPEYRITCEEALSHPYVFLELFFYLFLSTHEHFLKVLSRINPTSKGWCFNEILLLSHV